jgi:hypothetical protein
MEDLPNKDKSIQYIINIITETFGANYFALVDFWEGDNYALGLRKNEKLIYISTWNFKDCPENEPLFYIEFELVDSTTFSTLKIEKMLNGVNKSELISEIQRFVDGSDKLKI